MTILRNFYFKLARWGSDVRAKAVIKGMKFLELGGLSKHTFFKTLPLTASILLGATQHSLALVETGTQQIRTFGECEIGIDNPQNYSAVALRKGQVSYRSGGSFWLRGFPDPFSGSVITATALADCVSGSSAAEFNISYNNGAEAGSSRAADDGMGLTFTFRGSTYDYRLIGATVTTVTASNSVFSGDFPPPPPPPPPPPADITRPAVTSVSVPVAGSYAVGQDLDFVVNFDEDFTFSGSPQLALTIGSTVRQAALSGSTANSLQFTYTIQSGDNDIDGIALGILDHNGALIKDAADNLADLTLNSVGSTSGVLVDTTAPMISRFVTPSNRMYLAGENIDFSVIFDDNVIVTTGGGAPQLSLTFDGIGAQQAVYVSGSGTDSLVFRYTVQTGDSNIGLGDQIFIGALSANGGSIQDAAGNNANLAPERPPAPLKGVDIDALAPQLQDLAGKPANGGFRAGRNLNFILRFSENVIVNTSGGTPQLAVNVGSDTRQAVYMSGSGSDLLTFTYTVQVGDDSNGSPISLGALSANGGVIQDAVGNSANLTPSASFPPLHTSVDAVLPTVSSVSVPADASYKAGDSLDFTVNFDETVRVTGTPQLAINVGSTTRQAGYVSGTNTSALLFRYVVQAGDTDGNGIAIGALATNGGTIRDVFANNAELTLNNVGATNAVRVDTTAPMIMSINGIRPNTAITDADTLVFRFTFSEAVLNFDPSDLVVSGTTATVTSITSGATIRDVTISGGDLADLNGTVSLNFASSPDLQDAAGNLLVSTTPHYPSRNTYTVDNRQPQTISFPPPPPPGMIYGDVRDISATSDSGLPVTFSTPSSTVCEVNGSQVRAISAGTCVLRADQAGNASFSAAEQVSFNLGIGKRDITVTPNAQSKNYGDTLTLDNTAFSITSGSLVTGESIDTIPLTSAGNVHADATANVATYANSIIVRGVATGSGGFQATNYNIAFGQGDFIVNKRPISLTASTQSKEYGDTISLDASAFTVSSGSLINGEIIGEVNLRSETSIDSNTGTDAATYDGDIRISGISTSSGGFDANNYDIQFVAGDLEVKKRPITITANTQQKELGTSFTLSVRAFTVLDKDGDSSLPNGERIVKIRTTSAGGFDGDRNAPVGIKTDDLILGDIVWQNFNLDANNHDENNYDITRVAGDFVIVDTTGPTITLGALTAVGDGTYTSAITLSEADSGNLLEQSDLTVGNGSATLSGTGTSRTATITPTANFEGTVTLDVAAAAFTDATGNNSVAATQVSIAHDSVAPTITLGALTAVGDGTYTSAITLSETDSGNLLQQSDLTVGNGSATLSGTGTSKIATITPTANFEGTVTLDVAAGAFTDAAGNNNLAATQVSIAHDSGAPTITLGALTAVGDGTYTSAITLSEVDSGNLLQQSDLTVGNGSATLSGTGTSRIATITPTANFVGTVTLDVAAGAFTDAAGNNNLAATQVSIALDSVAPTIALGAITGPVNGQYFMVITLSEEPANGTTFDADDVTVENGSATMRGSGLTRTLVITPASNGPLSVSVAAGKFTDAAGNSAEAGTVTGGGGEALIVHDGTAPTVVLGELVKQSDDTYTSTITLSEAAGAGSNFDVDDLILTNATATLSGSGTSFTANLTAVQLGQQLVVSVPANAFTDAASNGNLASNNVSVVVDVVKQTQQLISNVMQSNARMILQNQPSLTRRLDRLEGRAGRTGALSAFGLNVENSGLPFDAKIGREGGTFSFSLNRTRQKQGHTMVRVNPLSAAGSFGIQVHQDGSGVQDELTKRVLQQSQNRDADYAQRRIDQAHSKPIELDGDQNSTAGQKEEQSETNYGLVNSGGLLQSGFNAGEAPELPRYDFWIEGTMGRQSVEDGRANFAIVHAGADYLVTPALLLGLGVQFDWTNFEANSAALSTDAKSDGFGFMVGPYLTTKLNDNLYLDARVSLGQSYNNVSPLGTFKDEVTTDRILASASLIGQMQWDEMTIRPQVRANYYRAESQAYTDSLGFAVPGSILETGTLEFGPSFEKSYDIGNNFVVTPKFSFDGIWTFAERNTTPSSIARSNVGLSGRLQAGVDLASSDGFTLSLSGRYDGIGQSDYEAYSGSVRISHRW